MATEAHGVFQSKSEDQPRKLNLIGRESSELIVGFSGAVGSGLDQVIDQTRDVLKEAGYSIEYIKISAFIERLSRETGVLAKDTVIAPNSPDRYDVLQTAGNKLRERFSLEVLAKLAISRIASYRAESVPKDAKPTDISPKKVAFLIDQLKHPKEVDLLRRIYGNLFLLVGVFASEEQRRRNLIASMQPSDAQKAMDRDRSEDEEHGQHLDKTLKLSDLFVRNTDANRASTGKQLRRLFTLVHGAVASTPTPEEYAMYTAYAAGLRSACMSRQVGAAITDSKGIVVATGCNDVPKGGGGLYTASDDEKDWRCFNWKGGECWNDHHKDRIRSDIEKVLASDEAQLIMQAAGLNRSLNSTELSKIGVLLSKQTRLKHLLEFSRAVHAEMDAIVSIARTGGVSLAGGSLFTTTFPCHNCARHIVAAGIRTVYYIEPYEKSLALDLHSDAIVGDPTDQDNNGHKVHFLHFEGIAPRQYQNLFTPSGERKVNNKVRGWSWTDNKVSPQYLDSYRDLEIRVIDDLASRGLTAEQQSKIVTS